MVMAHISAQLRLDFFRDGWVSIFVEHFSSPLSEGQSGDSEGVVCVRDIKGRVDHKARYREVSSHSLSPT